MKIMYKTHISGGGKYLILQKHQVKFQTGLLAETILIIVNHFIIFPGTKDNDLTNPLVLEWGHKTNPD